MAKITKTALKAQLTPQQQLAAELLMENEYAASAEKRKQEEIAQEVGVTDRTLRNWKKNEAFTKWLEYICDTRLSAVRAQIDSALVKGAVDGNAKMMEIYYKNVGKLVDKREVVVDDRTETTQVSAKEVADSLAELESLL